MSLNISPETEARIAARAQQAGVSVNTWLDKLVDQDDAMQTPDDVKATERQHAVARILKLAQGKTVGGLSARDLIEENRR